MLPNVPYFPVAYFGVLRAGGVVVPMNVLLKGREVAFYLEDSGAKLLFAWHEFGEAAQSGAEQAGAEVIDVKPGEFEQLVMAAQPDRDVADVAGDDIAVILYTSGTTGTPKGAELTHDNLRKQRGDHDRPRPLHRGRRRPGRAAAVPLVRADVLDERDDPRRRPPDADPALRSRQGARDHPARQGDDLRGRAHDVRGDAPPPEARLVRRLVAAPVLLGRLGDAGGGHARLRGGVRLQDPRGLRARRRPRRWRRSTISTASARPARSARRSRASR